MFRNTQKVTTAQAPDVSGKPFYGRRIVAASLAHIFYISGTFYYGFGTFFKPIVETFKWSYGATSLAWSMQRLEGGIAAPIVGFLVDRVGPRRVALFGVALAGTGFLLLSRMNSLWMFYLFFLLTAVGLSACAHDIFTITITNWFIRLRGRALSIFFVASGVGSVLTILLAWLIGEFGWRTTLVMVGLGTWAIGFPVALTLRHRPEDMGQLPDGVPTHTEPATGVANDPAPSLLQEVAFTPRQALATRAFWLLALAMALSTLSISATFVHEIPALESYGFSRQRAAFVLTFMALSSTVGRFIFGWAADYVEKRYLLVVAYALQSIGMFLFANIHALWQAVPFLISFGLGYGGTIPLNPTLLGEYFGRRNFGTIQGLLRTFTMVGGIMGPTMAGFIYDATDAYRLAFTIYSVAVLGAIPAVLIMRRPKIAPAYSAEE